MVLVLNPVKFTRTITFILEQGGGRNFLIAEPSVPTFLPILASFFPLSTCEAHCFRFSRAALGSGAAKSVGVKGPGSLWDVVKEEEWESVA